MAKVKKENFSRYVFGISLTLQLNKLTCLRREFVTEDPSCRQICNFELCEAQANNINFAQNYSQFFLERAFKNLSLNLSCFVLKIGLYLKLLQAVFKQRIQFLQFSEVAQAYVQWIIILLFHEEKFVFVCYNFWSFSAFNWIGFFLC